MKNQRKLLLMSILLVAGQLCGQVYLLPSDNDSIGYYNRPYQRYEAEPGYCHTNGQFLPASDDQRDLQSEASHQQCVNLINPGDTISWIVDQPGDGLTIRFSLPDNNIGTGIVGYLDVYANGEQLGFIYLSSYWAWQYGNNNYPDNTPRTNVITRMRFDENHLRLSRTIRPGEVLTLRKNDQNTIPYTVDFVELEPIPAAIQFNDIAASNKIAYNGQGDIADFIMSHQGQTIYIPEGTHATNKRIYLCGANGTQLIGAGMWYSQIYFSAPSDNSDTYNQRGIEANKNNLLVEGIYLNTACRQRYYNQDDSKQVGKGFMGGWGRNSVIRNCWVEHFECGAWIATYNGTASENLLVENCRFRNNYADGFNCSQNAQAHRIQFCSFRNNGDDDMASWSTTQHCSNIEYAYCTAENNWRASSLGFFGGKKMTAHHLYIADGLEAGIRVNAVFPGCGFHPQGIILLHDIRIEHCGCRAGNKGQNGDFWGNAQPALAIGGGSQYDIQNVTLQHITIHNCRSEAVQLTAESKLLQNTRLEQISVDGATTAFHCGNPSHVVNTTYCNLRWDNVQHGMDGCDDWIQDSSCSTGISGINHKDENKPVKSLQNGKLVIWVNGRTIDALGHTL